MHASREAVVGAARALLGRTDVNFRSTSPADGLVCIDVFVLACEGAGIPFRDLMRRLYLQNPGAYPPDGGTPADVNFPRRIRNVIAFLAALGLWHPAGPALAGSLIAFADGPGEPAHSAVVSEAGEGRAVAAVMTTSYGGPLAVREVALGPYLAAHPEFTVAGYGDPPLGRA
ncbi:MAG: hypothetical protein ACM3X6_05970 [Patescibacteria group bacterium]